MNQIMLVFSPQWLPINPYSSVPVLAGQLRQAGYEAVCRDCNLEFYNHVLEPPFLEDCLRAVTEREPMEEQEREEYERCIRETPGALRTVREGEDFYQIERYQRAMETLQKALFLVSLRYPGQKISLYNFYDARFAWEYRNLKTICSGEIPNMFYDYFLEQLHTFEESGASCVCISMPCYTQLVPAFTLARLLKKHTKLTVCMGGNILTRLAPGIRADRDMLEEYCDYLLLGDGERALVSFAGYLEGKCRADEVPGLVWKDGDCIFANPVDRKRDMESIAFPDFRGIDLKGYFCPELCFAIEFGRGCYWGKCSFCAVDVSAKKYCMKPVERLVDEAEYLATEYGIRNFVFVDEAIPVKKYVQFADMVLERGLKIRFYSFARLEKEYTAEALTRLREAGLSILWWGYEARSERIMKLMNKGIDTNERIPILQRAYDAGIWNHCLCMAGFPTETPEEIGETIAEIRSHRELFNSCAMNAFFLSYNSAMYQKPEEYGITSVAIPRDMESHCEFRMETYTEEQYQQLVNRFRKEYEEENRHRLWAQIYNNFDHLLLYLKHYGIERVREWDLRNQE